MAHTVYNKMVRDNVVDDIIANGKTPEFKKLADDSIAVPLLFRKVIEEAMEAEQNVCAEELADILSVVFAIGEIHGIKKKYILECEELKSMRLGRYSERVFLKSVTSMESEGE